LGEGRRWKIHFPNLSTVALEKRGTSESVTLDDRTEGNVTEVNKAGEKDTSCSRER